MPTQLIRGKLVIKKKDEVTQNEFAARTLQTTERKITLLITIITPKIEIIFRSDTSERRDFQ